MDAGPERGPLRVEVVVFHEELPRFVVEAGLGEGDDEEAAHDLSHVLEAHIRTPVALQSVHAHFALGRHVGVVDLGEEEASRRC